MNVYPSLGSPKPAQGSGAAGPIASGGPTTPTPPSHGSVLDRATAFLLGDAHQVSACSTDLSVA